MSFFSGLSNQISGFVASKTGGGEVDPNADPNAAVDPNAGVNGAEIQYDENGQPIPQEAPAGGVSGFAQGLMMKAMTAKQGIQEKAGALPIGNVAAMGQGVMGQAMNLIPGRKEEEVPPVDPNMVDQGEVQYDEQGQPIVYTE
jgi:hypothetical protein